MAIPRAVSAALGAFAILATAAVVIVYIILAQSLSSAATLSVRIPAALSATLETSCLVFLCWLMSSYLPRPPRQWSPRSNGVWSGVSIIVSTCAMALAVAAVVCFSSLPRATAAQNLGSSPSSFMVGASVVLGLAYALQLIFLFLHLTTTRSLDRNRSVTPGLSRESQAMTEHGPLKAIPYEQTSPGRHTNRESSSMEAKRAPSSSSKRSATETMDSIRSSLSQVIRPGSKSGLVSGSQISQESGHNQRSTSRRSSKRPPSLDSSTWKEPSLTALDGFDTWDTSDIDQQTRPTLLDASSSPPAPPLRMLETIPASPTTSRSPSPGTPLQLEPPKHRRRSRSYSPAPTVRTARPQRSGVSLRSAVAESHIHPLFRSDSPIPPPVVTPNTVVTAAPNAGQVISDRHSIRSLSRMRSGSLPTAPSPLSRQSSFDDFALKRDTSSPDLSISESPELLEEDEGEDKADSERTMTPPIPDWILSAGSRKILAGYYNRKGREADGEPSSESS